MLQLEAGEMPAHRAVLERRDRVGDARVDEALRANDGARPSRAVHDDNSLRIGCNVVNPQRQLRARHIGRGGNIHAVVLLERPRVDDHHVASLIEHRLDLGRGKSRGFVGMLDKLAKRLARHVDAGKEAPGPPLATPPRRHQAR